MSSVKSSAHAHLRRGFALGRHGGRRLLRRRSGDCSSRRRRGNRRRLGRRRSRRRRDGNGGRLGGGGRRMDDGSDRLVHMRSGGGFGVRLLVIVRGDAVQVRDSVCTQCARPSQASDGA